MKKKVIVFGLVLLSVVIYLWYSSPNIKGRYVARENSTHVIELKGPGQFSGNYTYYIDSQAVNEGIWWYQDGAWDAIEFDNWKNQGIYDGIIDTTPTRMSVQYNGSKLEFHPDLYEDDFIKE